MDQQSGSGETTEPLPAQVFGPGTVLNGLYRIDARLGEGGMGEVYRATSLANGTCYAVKIIARRVSGHPELEEMFRREARVQERIESTAVARLRMFGHDRPLDLLYFVTDFIEGESLLARLRRQPGSADEVRTLLRRLLAGLKAVHEAGAVHRDLSPDNIILPGGEVARAKLIDFGIAKETDATQMTVGGVKGKYGYMPPEQLGIVADARVGPWTDLYSLALTVIAFARGKPLDMGHSPYSAEQARRQPIDLSSVPPDLHDVLGRMLAFDWHERLRSASEVLGVLDGPDATVAPPPPPIESTAVLHEAPPPPWRPLRRFAALAIIAVGAVLLLWLARPHPTATSPTPSISTPATPSPQTTRPPLPSVARPPAAPRTAPRPSSTPEPAVATARPGGQPSGPPCSHNPEAIFFEPGEEELPVDAAQMIGYFALLYGRCGGAIKVTGITQSPSDGGIRLAEGRAAKVRGALVLSGIPDARVSATAGVETDPFIIGPSGVRSRLEPRVEIVMVGR